MTTTYPHHVEHKGHSVTIYSTPIRIGEPAFTIAYHECGKRKRLVRTDEKEAHDEADKIVKRLAGAEMKLTAGEANVYRTALEAIRDLKDKDGNSLMLDVVCQQFAQAWERAPGKVVDAAIHYSERSATTIKEGVMLDIAIEEFLATKKVDVSALFYREYKGRLNHFKGCHVAYPIAAITTTMIDDYLRGLKVEKRTRQNARSILRTFFAWGVARKYVPKDFDFNGGVAEVTGVKLRAVEILKPEELEKLLGKAEADLVPFIALQAFAGLRRAEAMRLDWSEINLGRNGEIEITAEKAKTQTRRTAPVLPCLRKWLKPYVKTSGPVVPTGNLNNRLLKLAAKAEIIWRRNSLRKSYISYRVKVVKSRDQVALECGNSPAIIAKHYDRVAKVAQDAKAWFNVLPGRAQNVVDMPKAA